MRPAPTPQIAPLAIAEAELVARARARDEVAIRSIMQANNRRLYRLARGILRNDGEAEDVVQETYVRAFTHLAEFRGDSSLATWLARIAMNEALGRLRRQRPAVELSSLPAGTLEAQIIQFPHSAQSEDPEKSMAQREIQHVVEHAIDELPAAFRIVFITRVIEGMNVEETAEILGLKPETVKTRLLSAAIAAVSLLGSAAFAQGAKPTDPQIAHIAYTAGAIDIAAAKLALTKTGNKDIKAFAEDMVRDHEAVNKQALALVKKLNVTPEDNDTSKTLSKNAADKLAELGKLKGAEFDKAYVANEVAYHKAVDSALETTLIPNASNAELKSLLQTGLKIFQGHEQHAEHVAAGLK